MDEKLVLIKENILKILILLFFLFSTIQMEGQFRLDMLNKKWLVYETISNSKIGWTTIINNYILDFTNEKVLKIKQLGNSNVENVEYSVNLKTGEISDFEEDVIYKIKKIDLNNLILSSGSNNSITIYLKALKSSKTNINFANLSKLLIEKKWNTNNNFIDFKSTRYKLIDDETQYKVFTETNNLVKYDGGWLVDSYENFVFLELISKRTNLNYIYKIKDFKNNTLKLTTYNKKGLIVNLEWNVKN